MKLQARLNDPCYNLLGYLWTKMPGLGTSNLHVCNFIGTAFWLFEYVRGGGCCPGCGSISKTNISSNELHVMDFTFTFTFTFNFTFMSRCHPHLIAAFSMLLLHCSPIFST